METTSSPSSSPIESKPTTIIQYTYPNITPDEIFPHILENTVLTPALLELNSRTKLLLELWETMDKKRTERSIQNNKLKTILVKATEYKSKVEAITSQFITEESTFRLLDQEETKLTETYQKDLEYIETFAKKHNEFCQKMGNTTKTFLIPRELFDKTSSSKRKDNKRKEIPEAGEFEIDLQTELNIWNSV